MLTCLSFLSLGNDDTKFYLLTNKDAPLYKVVTVDLADPDLKFVDLIPEDPEAPLEKARMVDGDKFVLTYKRNVSFSELFRSIYNPLYTYS